jgi:hypothetical protein
MKMWFVQTARTIDNIPKIGDKPLDLYQMYIEVEGLGGPEKVQATGLWHLVAIKMGYVTHEQNDPQLAHIAKLLADTYSALLMPFDQFCVERLRAVGAGVNQQRMNQLQALSQSMAMNANSAGAVNQGLRTGMLPGDNSNQMATGTYQRVFAYIHAALKDYMPELPPQIKLMRVSQMDIPQMQQLGWSNDRIGIIQKFKPMLLNFRANMLRQQAIQQAQQQASQGGSQLMAQQAQQAQQQQAHQQQQAQLQQHLNDHRSSNGGGSLPPNMQANIHGLAGPVKLPFPTDVTQRARLVVESISREIEQTRKLFETLSEYHN